MVKIHKKEIITICGGLGSGKSTTANMVAEKLNYKRFSSGDFFREIAIEMNLSVTELNKKAEKEKDIDFKVDEKLKNMRKENKIVIDSRTAYHWIPESFKIYLKLSPEKAKYRILEDLKNNEIRKKSENNSDLEKIYEKMQERFKSEQKRYWGLYKIDNTNEKEFDLIIDTEKNNLNQVVNIIIEKYNDWLKN